MFVKYVISVGQHNARIDAEQSVEPLTMPLLKFLAVNNMALKSTCGALEYFVINCLLVNAHFIMSVAMKQWKK